MNGHTGWGPGKHVVALEGRRDRLEIQSSKIHISLHFPDLSKGIVPFLYHHGRLRFGHLKPHIFMDQYNAEKSSLLADLKDAAILDYEGDWDDLKKQDLNRFQRLKCAAFWLQMIRISQRESWKYPALMRWQNNQWHLENGRSRILATGMTKSDPWKHLKVLYWTPDLSAPDPLDGQSVELQSDKDLHDMLGLGFDDTMYHQPIEMSLGVVFESGKLEIKWLHDGKWADEYNHETQKIWNGYASWRKKYGSRPKLMIFTNWPENIIDSSNSWDIKIVGPSQDFVDSMLPGKPGSLAWTIKNNIHNQWQHEHTIWIVKNTKIDVSDLICWMDQEHTTYLSNDYNFVLYRRDRSYKDIMVDITR